MKLVGLSVVFCILATAVFCQKKSSFKFVVDQPSVDTATGAYYGMQFEFSSERVYISDNEFAEKGLFTQDKSDKSALVFKYSGGKWYIKNVGGKWQSFYPVVKLKSLPLIKLNGKSFRFNWKEDEIFSGKSIAVFNLKPQGFISNHQPDYYFDCTKGIVGVKTSEITLIRTDFR